MTLLLEGKEEAEAPIDMVLEIRRDAPREEGSDLLEDIGEED